MSKVRHTTLNACTPNAIVLFLIASVTRDMLRKTSLKTYPTKAIFHAASVTETFFQAMHVWTLWIEAIVLSSLSHETSITLVNG